MPATGQVVDDAVMAVSAGAGARLLRMFTWASFVVLVFAAFAWLQFRGLRSPAAMEHAQLARSIAEGRGYTTMVVRPADLWYMSNHVDRPVDIGAFPDGRNAPLYPVLLATAFRIARPSFDVTRSGFFAPETAVIVPFGIACSALTAFLLYLIASNLFHPRWAITAVFVFIFTDTVLINSASGTPHSLAMMLTTASVYTGLIAYRRISDDSLAKSALLAATSLLLAAAAFLTNYALMALPLTLGVLFGSARRRHALWLPILCAACVVLLVSPWILRNMVAVGAPLGFAPWQVFADSFLFPGDLFDRLVSPEIRAMHVVPALKMKTLAALRDWLHAGVPSAGGGIIVALFACSYFSHVADPAANHLRWNILAAICLTMAPVILLGPAATPTLVVFLPFAVVFGTAFVFSLAARIGEENPTLEQAAGWILFVAAALPAVLLVAMPPVRQYPPFHPALASYVAQRVPANAAVCTDIPWATAWYGRRASLLLPASADDLQKLHPARVKVGAVYITTETSDRPYTSDLRTGQSRTWLPIINLKTPPGFTFTNAISLPPGSMDQVLLLP